MPDLADGHKEIPFHPLPKNSSFVATVGAYEAKTHLLQLLERVAKGEKITIIKHGVPVAMQQPADSSKKDPVREITDQLKRFRRDNRLEGISIRDMVKEGRR